MKNLKYKKKFGFLLFLVVISITLYSISNRALEKSSAYTMSEDTVVPGSKVYDSKGATTWPWEYMAYMIQPYTLGIYQEIGGWDILYDEIKWLTPGYDHIANSTLTIIPNDLYNSPFGSRDYHVVEILGNDFKILKEKKHKSSILVMDSNKGADRTLIDSGVFFSEIRGKSENELLNNYKKIATEDKYQTKSKSLWCYLTDSSNGKYEIGSRIDAFLHIDKLEINKNNMAEASDEDLDELYYRYIDLLLTLYAQIVETDSIAKKAWEAAIENYIVCNSVDVKETNSHISITNAITGYTKLENKEGAYIFSAQDYIERLYNIQNDYSLTNKENKNLKDEKGGKRSIYGKDYYLRMEKVVQASILRYKEYDKLGEQTYPNEVSSTALGTAIVSRLLHKLPSINKKSATMEWKTVYNDFNFQEYLLLSGKSENYGVILVPAYSAVPKAKKINVKFNANLSIRTTLKPDKYITIAETGTSSKVDFKAIKRTGIVEESKSIGDTPELILKLNGKKTDDDWKNWEKLLERYDKFDLKINITRSVKESSTVKAKKMNLNPTTYVINKKGVTKETLKTYLTKENAELKWKDTSITSVILDHEEDINLYEYEADVTIWYYKQSEGVKEEQKVEAKTNKVDITYTKKTEVIQDGTYASSPEAFSELKDGTIYQEVFEAMAGVPSTRPLYFSVGGSEFIAELRVEYAENQTATRTYKTIFAGTECEFKKNDALKGGTGTYSHAETFVADNTGKTNSKSVLAETSNIKTPAGNPSANVTVSGHNASTTLTAKWTGSINNLTSEPSNVDSYNAGQAGSPCPGNGFNPGTLRTKGEPSTNWEVNSYNTALEQAISWAAGMEATNGTYTIQRIADSDGQIRQYKVGEAVITVELSGGSNSHTNTVQRSYSGGTYTSSSASGARLTGTDKGRLGSGWGWSAGKLGYGTSYVAGCGHGCTKVWDTEPSEDNPGKSHSHNHACGSFTSAVDLTQAASGTIGYTITVTFKNGKVISGGNYDGASALAASEVNVGASLPAHALCGPCCQHELPSVEDNWSQSVTFNTLRITDVHVWKIEEGYVGGMTKIRSDAAEYADAVIHQGNPNIFYNIAASYSGNENSTLSGRIRYSLQREQGDTVVWNEMVDGVTTRSKKCNGLAGTISGSNPIKIAANQGHNNKWASGILYTNPTSSTTVDYHKEKADAIDKKTVEYERFDMRRNLKNTVTVVADMLILQTSSGDQSLLYYADKQTKTTQQQYDDIKTPFDKMWTENPNAAKYKGKDLVINIGSYNGQYYNTSAKYKGSGKGEIIETIYDADVKSAVVNDNTEAGETIGLANTGMMKIAQSFTKAFDNNLSSPSHNQARMPRVKDLRIYNPVIQNPINPNGEYVTGQSYAYYKELLMYDSSEYLDPIHKSEKDTVLNKCGITLKSRYRITDKSGKCNDIVVHDPVSASDAVIVAKPREADQRILKSASSAQSLLKEMAELETCPGTAALCGFRYLNCQFEKESSLASFDFEVVDTYRDESESATGTPTGSEDDRTIIRNIIKSGSSYRDYPLGAGFGFFREVGTFQGFGSGRFLYVDGVRTQIPLRDFGFAGKSLERIRIECNLYIPSISNRDRMLFSFAGYGFYIPAGKTYGVITTGNGEERIMSGNLIGSPLKFGLVMSMGSVTDCNLYINEVLQNASTNISSQNITDSLVGDFLNIGCWESNTDFATGFYLDNLKIIRMPGTTEHTDACYVTTTIHEATLQYLQKAYVVKDFAYTGTVQSFTAPVSGNYKLEVWGASGGDGTENNQAIGSHGGLGGYANGMVSLKKGQTVLVNIGGVGTGSTGLGTGGGYNGGGNGGTNGYGGGGATDIRAIDSPVTIASLDYFEDDGTLSGSGQLGSGWTDSGEDKITSYDADTVTVNKIWSDGWLTPVGDNPLLNVDSKYIDTIEIRLKNNTNGSFMQIHYAINGEWHNEPECIYLDNSNIISKNSDGYATYRVKITDKNTSWGSGKITGLRLDLCNSSSGTKSGSYVLDYIRFINSAGTIGNNIIAKNSSTSLGKFYEEAAYDANVTRVTLDSGEHAIKVAKGAYHQAASLPNVFTARHQYMVVFDAWSTEEGDVLHVDAHPDTLPEKVFRLTTERTTYSFSVTSDLAQMNNAALRVFDSGETPEGDMYVTNIRVYDVTADFRNRILVAGGGGGADDPTGEAVGAVNDGSGGAGGGFKGGNAFADGVRTAGKGITIPGSVEIGQKFPYEYGGTPKSEILSAGKYKLEVYGAQGGSGNRGAGGLGGYASGEITLTTETEIQINVGGMGEGRQQSGFYSNGPNAGGYNGGGASGRDTDYNDNGINELGGGGGGYTTIKINGTAVVTGGGGGGNTYTNIPGARGTGGAGGGSYSSQGSAGILADSGGIPIGGVFARESETYKATGYVNGSLADGGSVKEGVRTGNGYALITCIGTADVNNGDLNAGLGGTQIKGYQIGIGESATTDTDTGGAGGGYYGGYATNFYNGGAGGGSGYIGGVAEGITIDGDSVMPSVQGGFKTGHVGNGYARITYYAEGSVKADWPYEVSENNTHVPTSDCLTGSSKAFTLSLSAMNNGNQSRMKQLLGDTLWNQFSVYFGIKSGEPANITQASALAFLRNHLEEIPYTVDGFINPIWDCDGVYNSHVCTDNCRTERDLDCQEPHHYGHHYDYSNELCYSPCNNDHNHKSGLHTVKDKTGGGTIAMGDYINIDNYFQVYFPNLGDFYETTEFGIPSTIKEKGKGYTNRMDTTEWTREKWVRFEFSVLYNRNGTWEEYLTGEWIPLEVRDSAGNVTTTYDFYCLLSNVEVPAARVDFLVEAINNNPSPGGQTNIYLRDEVVRSDLPSWSNEHVRNFMRIGSKKAAYHTAYKYTVVDLVGRVGNLIGEDSEDLRFSNLFKSTANTQGWLIEGILKNVNAEVSNKYLSWHYHNGTYGIDVRGNTVSKKNGMYNTYGTQDWTQKAGAVPFPLAGDKNTVTVLKNENLKLGYNLLMDITTIGNYDDGKVQVLPYFYALNTRTNAMYPVDAYLFHDNNYEPINYFGLMSEYYDENRNLTGEYQILKDTLYPYLMKLNWVKEKGRRNYTTEEASITEKLAETNYEYIRDEDYNVIGTKLLTIPYGEDYALGTIQNLLIGARGRTFVGSSKVTAIDINGGTETDIMKYFDPMYFWQRGQRWHMTAGLPTSARFVVYRNGRHLNPTEKISMGDTTINAVEEVNSDEYVILMTAKIIAYGDTWTLEYNQGKDNGGAIIGGKTYQFGSDIPNLLAVYDTAGNTIDVDIIGTH
jgi:hypothetical protein